ncbi:MAG: hypothetical protein AW12_00870 [Candidatus Accumulibacter sp. BA-94]|uniref:hypothetical protein n=1 Tax=Accumulibacter sp. TaxID=2053492 RepID=UPI0004451660|nr:hypothetical protein [Accumulibacter sp.]EXI92127.1 MAG: hypothetical protein AW12_00870 [Candidatus Accumulibacter sp. BA-94]HRD86811.1 hypothetical protein [Accumulibacter sp.]
MAKILDPDLLTYIVDGSPSTENLRFNTSTKKIRLVAGGSLVAKDGVTGQCLFSKIKEVIRASSILISVVLPVREMIHDESMELINGWEFEDSTTLKMVRDCGVAYIATNGKPTAMYACFVTLGTVLSGAPYYVYDSATNATTQAFTHVVLNDSFCINELVQIYLDTNADGTPDYDRRGYAKVFLRTGGYTFDESDNGEIGYPVLTYKKYNFPISHQVDANVTVNDATVSAYTGMGITWYASAQSASLGTNGPYNYHAIIGANGKSHLETYSWVQWKLRQNADIDDGAGNRTGSVAAALVFMDGTTLKTRYQTGVGGVHVAGIAASSYNFIAEADDTGAYRTYPYTAALTCEFDSYLVADAGPSKFWVFAASDYGTPGSSPINDASATDIAGNVTAASMAFSYNWVTDVDVVGVAIGTDDAKIAIAYGTIEQSTGNKLVFVAGQERWYVNP